MSGRRSVRVLAAAVVVLVAASAFLASCDSTAEILGHVPNIAVTIMIALGPIGGWIGAIRAGEVARALWSLIPATLFTVGPFVLWINTRRVGWLVVSIVVWIAAGYLYGVAIWV